MPAERVIAATFSDVQPVKTRSVYKLIFEIPIEDADKAIELLGGHPQPGKEKWVALALLVEKPAQKAPEKAGKPKRAFSELSLPEQAGIRCEDDDFCHFIEAKARSSMSRDSIVAYVRTFCTVQSRAELATDKRAASRWRLLDEEFRSWQLSKQYADVIR